MRFLIDENMGSPRLASRLRAQGHDPVLAGDAGLLSATDARVLIWAIAQGLPVLTRDSEDFEDWHDRIMAAGGHHPGILVVRFGNDPRQNLTDRGIAGAISQTGSLGRSPGRSGPRAEPVALTPPPEVGCKPTGDFSQPARPERGAVFPEIMKRHQFRPSPISALYPSP
jgi:predicted nuclease of predicted toxin-antitoxin system